MLKLIIISIIILFYISLFVELFFYSIPSVVSTKQLLNPKPDSTRYFSEHIKTFFNWPLTKKLLVFVVPMLFIYILHALPLYSLYDLIVNEIAFGDSYFIIYLGIALVIIGRIISHFYLFNIKKIKTKTFDGFIVNGLFKITRNPGLLGLYISFLGFFLIQPSTLFFVCLVIYIIHMHYKIKMEEDYLTNKHGANYKSYLQKTRRYL